MRIAVDGQVLEGNLTGMGKVMQCVLRHLRQDFSEHEYVVIAPEDRSRWRLPQQLCWDQVGVPVQALQRGADLLHATGHSAPLLWSRRVVMTVYDLAPTRMPHLLPTRRSRWYWGWFIPFTAKFVRAVLAPSHSTKRDLVELCRIPEERIHVIPLGIPLDPPVAGGEQAGSVRRRYGLDGLYVLYVGTIDRRKDYPTLLQALLQLDRRISLIVAGTIIHGRTDFPQRVEQLDLKDRVRVLGYVPDHDLVGLYQGAAAFVYPSFYEGFGLPVLEAMACGTPVITYNTTSLPEVVGDAGILLDPPWTAEALADAIRRLLHDEALRLKLQQKGFERAKRFDWHETARQTMKVYEAVTSGQ
jgi:glycosyltransferase involved in cell wall biosynthesis